MSTSSKVQMKKKNDNAETGESPSSWNSPTKCVINTAEFLGRSKSYAHFIKGGLLEDSKKLKKVEKSVRVKFVAPPKAQWLSPWKVSPKE